MSGESEGRGQGERKPLVTVEYQTEINLGTGKRERRMFVKMFFDAVDDGLLRELSPRLWRGLCCIARYVDEDGVIRVSQERIASDLGISRQHANKLLGDLCDFRRPSTGERVLQQLEQGGISGGGEKFRSNVYKLYPVAGFQFGRGRGEESPVSPKGDRDSRRAVSPNGDSEKPVPCHPHSDTVPCHPVGDTYKRVQQETHTTPPVCVSPEGLLKAQEVVSAFDRAFGRSGTRSATEKEIRAAQTILTKYGEPACRHLIEYAREQAQRTRFEPRYFQAILSYLPDALSQLESRKAKHRVRNSREEARRAKEEAEEREWAAKSPEDRARTMFDARVLTAKIAGRNLTEDERGELWEKLLAAALDDSDDALVRVAVGPG